MYGGNNTTGRSFDIDRVRLTPAPSFTPEQPTIPGSLRGSDEAQADIVMILDPGDPLVEISVSDNFVRASEIRVSLGTRGCGIGTFYEDHIDGPAIDPTIPLSAVEEVLEIEFQDETDWARADKSCGFIEDHPPSLRIVEAPRTPLASSPPSHPPLPTLKKNRLRKSSGSRFVLLVLLANLLMTICKWISILTLRRKMAHLKLKYISFAWRKSVNQLSRTIICPQLLPSSMLRVPLANS